MLLCNLSTRKLCSSVNGVRLLWKSIPCCREFKIPSRKFCSKQAPTSSTKGWTIPNSMTFARILSAPRLTYSVYNDMKSVALIGCLIAGASDWLDGYIAKNYNMRSRLGEVIDPLADKVVIGCLTIGLSMKGLIPMSLMGVILGRDLVLLASSFYIRYNEKPKGAPMFDPTSFTYQIEPSMISKVSLS